MLKKRTKIPNNKSLKNKMKIKNCSVVLKRLDNSNVQKCSSKSNPQQNNSHKRKLTINDNIDCERKKVCFPFNWFNRMLY